MRPFPWEAHYPEGLAWALDLAPRPLFTLLDEACATLRRAALSRLPRPQVELPRDRPAGRPRGQGLPGAGGGPRRPGRPVPAQLPLLRDLLFRRAQGRRHGGQLQPALRRARDRPPDRGFADLDHGHPQHQGHVSQGRAAACRHLPEDDRGGLDGRPFALARAHAVRAPAAQGDRRRPLRRSATSSSRS